MSWSKGYPSCASRHERDPVTAYVGGGGVPASVTEFPTKSMANAIPRAAAMILASLIGSDVVASTSDPMKADVSSMTWI